MDNENTAVDGEAKGAAPGEGAPPPASQNPQTGLGWLASLDQTKVLVSFIAALAAIVTPTTTCILKSFELDVARVEQQHKMALQRAEQETRIKLQTAEQQQKFMTDFLSWVLGPDRKGDSYFRRDVLSFFAAALEEGRTKAWAQAQLDRVNQEIGETEQLRRDVALAQQKLATLESDRAKQIQDIEYYRRQGQRDRAAVELTQRKLRTTEAGLQEAALQAQLSAAKLDEQNAAIGRHVKFHNPCPPGWLFTTGAADLNRGLLQCSFEAPPNPGTKVWRVRVDGQEFSCGCQPQPAGAP